MMILMLGFDTKMMGKKNERLFKNREGNQK